MSKLRTWCTSWIPLWSHRGLIKIQVWSQRSLIIKESDRNTTMHAVYTKIHTTFTGRNQDFSGRNRGMRMGNSACLCRECFKNSSNFAEKAREEGEGEASSQFYTWIQPLTLKLRLTKCTNEVYFDKFACNWKINIEITFFRINSIDWTSFFTEII